MYMANNILFVIVKIIGIVYAVILFCIIGLINAKILDYSFCNDEDDDKYKQYTLTQNILIILKLTIVVAILCFIGRNIAERIPFVFENVEGFKYMRLKEINSGSILLMFSILFSSVYYKTIQRIR